MLPPTTVLSAANAGSSIPASSNPPCCKTSLHDQQPQGLKIIFKYSYDEHKHDAESSYDCCRLAAQSSCQRSAPPSTTVDGMFIINYYLCHRAHPTLGTLAYTEANNIFNADFNQYFN
jgi:hypothetical protein